jgi:hypothetical protein
MGEKKRDQGNAPELPRLEQFPVGSLESRVAARVFLAKPSKPPNMLVSFVAPGPRDQNDQLVGPPSDCDSHRASIGLAVDAKSILRFAEESLADFKERVEGELPVTGGSIVIFWADDEPRENRRILPDVY